MPNLTGVFDQGIIRWGAPATFFNPDGVSGARSARVIVDNISQMTTLGGGRGDPARAFTTSDQRPLVQPGQLLQVPAATGAWYLVVRQWTFTVPAGLPTPAVQLELLPLPAVMTAVAERINPATQQVEYHDTGTVIARCGVTKTTNPAVDSATSGVPILLIMAYVPLGTVLPIGGGSASMVMIAGTPYEIVAHAPGFSDGGPYCIEAQLNQSVGAVMT